MGDRWIGKEKEIDNKVKRRGGRSIRREGERWRRRGREGDGYKGKEI